jgi:hypothetical protein
MQHEQMMREIITRRALPFARDQVWSVLTDFGAYRDWNPLNVAADGVATRGARVRMTFIDPGHPGRTITQRVRIIAADPLSRLAWIGSVPVLFSGEHYFELKGSGQTTELRHGERLNGLLPLFWDSRRMNRQRLAYEAMNDALQRRLELLFENTSDQ